MLQLEAKVVHALANRRLACEYQPIVATASERVFGYESLARFVLDGQTFAPNQVFGSLHDDRTTFFLLESRAKSFQIEHRPKDARLFLNVDPHVCEEQHQLEHWLEAFGGEPDLIVEIIENTTLTNLESIQRFTASLAERGIDVALDDVGGSRNLFSFELLESCNYVKLDRRWFGRLEMDPAYRSLISGLVQFAKARGIGIILEGVETRHQLGIARTLGVDYVQGYLFRDAFVTIR